MSSLVAAGSSSGSSSLLIFAPLLLLVWWMYYSNRRRVKQTQALQSSLGIGDEVTTTSGLLGRITALEGQIVTLEVSPGVTIRFNRRAIAGPAPTEPVSPIEPATSDSDTDAVSDPAHETD